jgi:protein-S-isoprenylcysteine O-methyltransferase Ste14
MNPWYAKAVILLASVAMVAIRAPHGHRSSTVPIVIDRRDRLEVVLLTLAWIAFFLPLLWIVTPLFAFAGYRLHPVPFIIGTLLLAFGLWLFHRSHADLGRNWSISLQVRENHQLIKHGVYRWIRHPMYLALLTFALGQALVIPNWFVGPSDAIVMVVLVALRIGREEQMMREEFGQDYVTYSAKSKRLIPGIW